MRRHSATPLILLLLVCLLAGGVLWQKQGWVSGKDDPVSGSEPAVSAQTVSRSADSEAKLPNSDTRPVSPVSLASQNHPDPARFRRAYVLNLDGDSLQLRTAEDIEGDFGEPAQDIEVWSGMLRCRLLDVAGKTLAEELITAPDHLCTVLDAREDGKPKPVKYRVPGPALFQLRLPRRNDAVKLDITRVIRAGSIIRDQPVGSVALSGS